MLVCYVVLICIYKEGVESVAFNLMGKAGELLIPAVRGATRRNPTTQPAGSGVVNFTPGASWQAGFHINYNGIGAQLCFKAPRL